ncbi:MAG TPA: hypothetical protein VHG11_00140, partial [Pseudorhizobium sp.]|nr:hypothetical protein [Pseudorhizobium sp.]
TDIKSGFETLFPCDGKNEQKRPKAFAAPKQGMSHRGDKLGRCISVAFEQSAKPILDGVLKFRDPGRAVRLRRACLDPGSLQVTSPQVIWGDRKLSKCARHSASLTYIVVPMPACRSCEYICGMRGQLKEANAC